MGKWDPSRTCGTCIYFHHEKESCRVDPPRLVPTPVVKPHPQNIGQFVQVMEMGTAFPSVSPGDWCGKWRGDLD